MSKEWSSYWPQWYEMMRNRMTVSGVKYGGVPLSDAYPLKVDALKSLQQRLDKYHETHNTELLIDAANFALIEATCPRYPDATFRSTDSDESPGLAKVSGGQEHGAASKSRVAQIRNMK